MPKSATANKTNSLTALQTTFLMVHEANIVGLVSWRSTGMICLQSNCLERHKTGKRPPKELHRPKWPRFFQLSISSELVWQCNCGIITITDHKSWVKEYDFVLRSYLLFVVCLMVPSVLLCQVSSAGWSPFPWQQSCSSDHPANNRIKEHLFHTDLTLLSCCKTF